MGKNQYQVEERVADSLDVELDNLIAQNNALSTFVQDSADDISRIAELTQWLYGRQRNAKDAAFIHETYEIANRLGVRVTQSDLANAAAIAFAKMLLRSHGKLAGENEELCQELDKVEGDLVDMRHEINRLDASYRETMTTAYKQIFAELHNGIRNITGCGEWALVYRLTDVLVGNKEPTDEQCRLLIELLSTFEESEQAS